MVSCVGIYFYKIHSTVFRFTFFLYISFFVFLCCLYIFPLFTSSLWWSNFFLIQNFLTSQKKKKKKLHFCNLTSICSPSSFICFFFLACDYSCYPISLGFQTWFGTSIVWKFRRHQFYIHSNMCQSWVRTRCCFCRNNFAFGAFGYSSSICLYRSERCQSKIYSNFPFARWLSSTI